MFYILDNSIKGSEQKKKKRRKEITRRKKKKRVYIKCRKASEI